MAYSLKKLRSLSDEELVNEHDEKAKSTVVGTQYYMDELDRRSRERYEKATYRLSWLSAIASISAVVASIISLHK